ncbi:DsbA family protein [Sphingomicrobium marinum]|uniref:DsbA family protein n=1 Tax=Sphingomicrobium marinum TaxID=1227950 RepID=UPI0022409C53|nr:DsbA family protein [Sphingomicrobium marinum]
MSENSWGPAIAGGAFGAVLTAIGGYFALQAAAPGMVRGALIDNPEMLVEASNALQTRQHAPTIEANRDLIETPYENSWVGAENPEVIMVEFFDYACGYCRQTKPDIDRLVEEMPNLRVVYRELPVLGQNSVLAARASMAASRAGKFKEFHDKLYGYDQLTQQAVAETLQELGLDPRIPESPEWDAELQKNFDLANQFGPPGTPMFVIGDRLIPAAEGYVSYKRAIDAALKDKS